ncbi:MAG: META domain-containing protein [Chloroflexi bacterium]|nr:MAG: META domain-containing protein [Chloroflexota bacterium]
MRNRLLSALMLAGLLGIFAPASSAYATSVDPCAPAEDGSVPEMCQGGVAYPEMGGAFFSAEFTQLVTAGELSRALFNIESGSITFSDGSLSATVGCNNVFGSAELTIGDPSTITLSGPLASTKMFCEGLMEAEAALISILEGEFLSIVGDGITSSNGMIRVEGGVPIAMPDVIASEYPPFMIQVDGTNYDVTGGYVVIDGDQLSASVGCNTLGGGVLVDGDTLTLDGPLISTMMYCEGLMDAEAALATVLQGENLTWVSPFELRSDAGAVIFASLCGDCVTPPGEPSDPTGLAIALALLFAPIGAAAVALSRGLATTS